MNWFLNIYIIALIINLIGTTLTVLVNDKESIVYFNKTTYPFNFIFIYLVIAIIPGLNIITIPLAIGIILIALLTILIRISEKINKVIDKLKKV